MIFFIAINCAAILEYHATDMGHDIHPVTVYIGPTCHYDMHGCGWSYWKPCAQVPIPMSWAPERNAPFPVLPQAYEFSSPLFYHIKVFNTFT